MIQVHDLRLIEPEQVRSWADHVAANMRRQDVAEVAATSGLSPQASIEASIALSSDAYCVTDRDDTPILMFGAAPYSLPGVGIAWLLGTDGILRERHSIARLTTEYVQRLQQSYWMLWNLVDARNSVSIRWLEWAGFLPKAEHTHGPDQHRLITYVKVNRPCATP